MAQGRARGLEGHVEGAGIDLPLGLIVPDGDVAQEGVANRDPGAPLGRELSSDLSRNAGAFGHTRPRADQPLRDRPQVLFEQVLDPA